MAAKLPGARFECGLTLVRRFRDSLAVGGVADRWRWTMIGRLDDGTPFLLSYAGGATQWTCERTLGDGLRKKILDIFREEVRRRGPLPDFVVEHDLREMDGAGSEAADRIALEATRSFLRDVWRAEYLGDRDEDYVALAVPFADKDAAKALGARWDGEAKVWRVRRRDDMSAFAAWLPEVEAAAAAPGP